MIKQFVRARHSFSNLQSILSKMKVANEHEFPKEINKLGTSNLFAYATDTKFKGKGLQSKELRVWNKLTNQRLHMAHMKIPSNGFEEAIQMTEEGRMWHYPIDNELGMDEEKQVPFEEHVFLEKHLEDFPRDESIQGFMRFIVAGLAKNPWMTAQRKRDAIKYYKDYFESKRELYKEAGYDI